MKALTIQQPWAWAIMHGKLIENRTANWTYRGKIAVHAGQRWSTRGAADPRIHEAWAKHTGQPVQNIGESLSAADFSDIGVVVAVAELTNVHADVGCCRPWGESAYTESGGRTRHATTHLVLDDIRPLPEPIECRGALGLWTPSSAVVEEIRSQLGDPE